MRNQARGQFHAVTLALSLAMVGCLGAEPLGAGDPYAGDLVDYHIDYDGEWVGDEPIFALLSEGFESGTKTAYATGDVTLGSGSWRFTDALIGDLATDVKSGSQSARVRNSGRLTQLFNRTTGAGTVTIGHASFGSDASSTWGLFSSTNSGSTWTQVGTTRSTAVGSLATATFTANISGTVRFELRKLDGSTNRINFDSISITDFGTPGGGGGGGGPGAGVSRHTALGLPTSASTSTNDFLSVKSGFVLSYNSSRRVPNWVSWELSTSFLGSTDRQDDFRVDSSLPTSLTQAQLADYSGSGYDRGHMCPSADRTASVAANSQTFLLTNMIPQAPNNNQGPWAAMENDLRAIAQTGKTLYIISGGTFSGSSNTIGSGVVVPDQTFKVVVVLDAGQNAGSVSSTTRVIAVRMPNEDSQISRSATWRSFRVSVDSIESQTGQNFMSDVDSAVQSVIEARVDNL